MSKGEESTIPADGIKALSQEKKCEVNYISFKPKPKRERENAVVEQSDDKTISVMEKGADYMSSPTEDHIVEIEGQGNSTYTAGMEDITMEDSEHGGK